MKTWGFTVMFARTDEDPARVHTVGFNVMTDDNETREVAERKLRAAFDHLIIIDVTLFAILNEDGEILEG